LSPGTDARALAELLARTPLTVRRGPYALGAWSRAQASAVGSGLLRSRSDVALHMADDLEVTALLRESALAELPPPRGVQRGFAIITLDTVMGWDLTGVLAAVTAPLASAGIPVAAFTAFSRDHVLVPWERLDEALAALSPLCGPVRAVD
jgi:hypothetical protein